MRIKPDRASGENLDLAHKHFTKCQVTNRFLLKAGPLFIGLGRVAGRWYTTGWIQRQRRLRSSGLLLHIPPVIGIPTIPVAIGIRILRILRIVLIVGIQRGRARRATRRGGCACAALRATGLFWNWRVKASLLRNRNEFEKFVHFFPCIIIIHRYDKREK